MAKGKPDSKWKERVLDYEASRKSMRTWCQENNIPITTLAGWKSRFKGLKVKSGFIELQDHPQSDSGITLEYSGIKIHLKPKFDQAILKQCLSCIGALC